MTDFVIQQELPSPQEYNRLREAVGWKPFAITQCEIGLRASLFCVCARHDHELAGMGRIVGDGALCFYLQDIIVSPRFQRRGLGTALVERLMEHLRDNAPADAYVRLFAAKDVAPFYERFGFAIRPTDSPAMQMPR